jgi:hypothetical protein
MWGGRVMARNGEAGQTLPFIALGLVFLIGILGLGVDMGFARYMRRQMQTAADAAAVAGAIEIAYGDYANAAQQAATENGFTNGAGGKYPITVTISSPPVDGAYTGSQYSNFVEAKITQAQPTFFGKIFGVNSIGPLTTWAVAEGSVNCIYALDPSSGNNALHLSFAVVKSLCGAVDNASVSLSNSSFCAASIQYLGSAPVASGGLCKNGRDLLPNPPLHITKAVTDPFAYLTPPCTGGACAPAACVPGRSTLLTINANGGTPQNIPAGSYCGGITVNAGANVTFNAPTFVNNGITINTGILNLTIVNFASPSSAGVYNINGAAGQPGIKVNAGLLTLSAINFFSGTYYIAGGISDTAFISFENVNFNASCATHTACTNPALFVLDGGGLNLNGVIASGGGETFFNTNDATHTAGPVNFVFGTGSTFMQAPSTGGPTCSSCAGLLFWQPSTNTQAAQFNVSISGDTGTAQGAYYFPNSPVNFFLDLGFGADYTYLVAKDINWNFNFTFNRNIQTLPNGSPIREGTALLVQ